MYLSASTAFHHTYSLIFSIPVLLGVVSCTKTIVCYNYDHFLTCYSVLECLLLLFMYSVPNKGDQCKLSLSTPILFTLVHTYSLSYIIPTVICTKAHTRCSSPPFSSKLPLVHVQPPCAVCVAMFLVPFSFKFTNTANSLECYNSCISVPEVCPRKFGISINSNCIILIAYCLMKVCDEKVICNHD